MVKHLLALAEVPCASKARVEPNYALGYAGIRRPSTSYCYTSTNDAVFSNGQLEAMFQFQL